MAAAEVVLRRAGQRAVRGDHRAAGVLPDPGRARDPGSDRAGRDRGGDRRPHPGRAGLRPSRRRACCWTRSPNGPGCAAMCRSTQRAAPSPRPGEALVAERPGLQVHALIADFTAGLTLPDTPGPRLVAFLGGTRRQPAAPSERAAFLRLGHAPCSPGRQPAAGHGPGQGRGRAGPRLRRRGRGDGRVQRERAVGW